MPESSNCTSTWISTECGTWSKNNNLPVYLMYSATNLTSWTFRKYPCGLWRYRIVHVRHAFTLCKFKKLKGVAQLHDCLLLLTDQTAREGLLIRQAWRGPVYWRPNDQAGCVGSKIENMRTEVVLSTWVVALALGMYKKGKKGAMLVHPRLMCPRPKILGCCIPWTKCPLSIVPLTEPSHP